jgi:4a-hydroxytetrahydrobiopterin dehydratase
VNELAQRTCVPCRGDTPAMTRDQAEAMLRELGGGWDLAESGYLFLRKGYRFKDFAQALAFVDRIGALAEEQAHHPDVYLAWGRVRLEIWTHKIKGLTESDFIFAAKCDERV